MKYQHILWDFNGTLLDDVAIGIEAVNAMLSKRSLPVIPDRESYREVFGFPISEYYQRLGFDFAKEPYEVLAPEWVQNYKALSPRAAVRGEAVSLLLHWREQGMAQTLLSATEQGMLEEQLRSLSLYDLFDEICGLDTIHAHSKVALAEAWREKHAQAHVLVVGDTVHDAQVAEAIGADCILVEGGHQSRRILESTGYPVARDFAQVLAAVG